MTLFCKRILSFPHFVQALGAHAHVHSSNQYHPHFYKKNSARYKPYRSARP
jgi:hypothetical protein